MSLGHLSPKTILTTPHQSEGSHYAFDHHQSPNQANISITLAKTYQNGEAIIYSQSSLRVPPPQIASGEQKQAVAWQAQARKQQIREQCAKLAELQLTVSMLHQQERQRYQSHLWQFPYPSPFAQAHISKQTQPPPCHHNVANQQQL
jgi:hypothetical protein